MTTTTADTLSKGSNAPISPLRIGHCEKNACPPRRLAEQAVVWYVRWYEIAISFLHCPFLHRNILISKIGLPSQISISQNCIQKIRTDFNLTKNYVLKSMYPISDRLKSVIPCPFYCVCAFNV